jgi:hypothetical protein
MCQLRSGPISAQGVWLAHHRESHGPAAEAPAFEFSQKRLEGSNSKPPAIRVTHFDELRSVVLLR